MTADNVPKSEAGANLAQSAADARERAAQFAQDAKQEAEGALADARVFLQKQWSERPLATAAFAIGLGALIGLALSKRR